MKSLLTLLSVFILAIACSSAEEKYQQRQEEARKDYEEAMTKAEEDYREAQKEEAVDYVKKSEEARKVEDKQRVDVIEE